MAFLTLSLGMLASRASSIALRRRGLPSGLAPPVRAAIAISRTILVKCLPRLLSIKPFLCLMPAQRECPDMRVFYKFFAGFALGRDKLYVLAVYYSDKI